MAVLSPQPPRQRQAGIESLPPPEAGAARVIARGVSRRERAALQETMATLALDARQPVALELARDEQGLHFQLRASTPQATAHLTSQLQALYPQARMAPLSPRQDPLRLERNEAVTVVELGVGGQPYLSLRTPDERSWHSSGNGPQASSGDDPLLAVLGALQAVPPGMRAIMQLALVPASAQWSRPYQRKAVEHPLEPERERERRQERHREGGGPSIGMIVALGLLVVLALLWRRFGAVLLPLVPQWLRQDVLDALRGHLLALSSSQIMQVAAVLALVFVLVFLASRLCQHMTVASCPPEVTAPIQYGPRIGAVAVYLTQQQYGQSTCRMLE